MNPLLLRLGIGVLVAVVTCVVAYRNSRRQQALYQPSHSSFDGSSVTVCGVCLEEFTMSDERKLITLPCKHKCHKICIKNVFAVTSQSHRSCPLCRYKVDSTFVENVLKSSDF